MVGQRKLHSSFYPRRRKPKEKIRGFTKREIKKYKSLLEEKFGNNGKNGRKKNGNGKMYFDWDDEKLINEARSKAEDGISLAILDYKLYLELWRRELPDFAYPTKRRKV